MAKARKKKRTHVPNNDRPGKPGQANRPPKSMVIRMGAGDVGSSVTQLARDFRAVMEPDTASRLKERRANKLKDYTAMAGPLGVTHLFLFSRSKSGNVHLRVALTPRGPTLTFRVERYALCKDIAKAQKHPRGGGNEYLNAPLLVMNNFTSQASSEDAKADPIKKQLESLTTTIFQSIFPPISPQTTPLSSIRRILLLNREPQSDGTYIINLRHYAITTRRTGVSKRVRRFDPSEQRLREKKSGALPNLGKLEDVADYILDPSAGGYTSASETELDTDAEIEVLETTTQRVLSRREQLRQRQQEKQQQNGEKDKDKTTKDSGANGGGSSNVEKRAVKLVELGPRMRLRMVKVEDGICEGRVMWNEFVTKTEAEEKALEEKWTKKRQEKEARRKEQRENVERKKLAKKNAKINAGQGDGEDDDEEDEEEDEEWDSDDMEDWEDDDHDDEMDDVGAEGNAAENGNQE
ncbi:uncharacterized protein Z520_04636 [Fonsecaea multimorphosa CBS 102226]|uniref:Brix domain-containing protein n=1 Tax=Fonsecaea multimorphosa CBS 102226 TaxID=1442371 RepID=A0A0D2KTC7_9EURO|nr:uncharacterized protein Z520_04636 [Fonsecaea multimorphosa CBS 102226]KIX99998.1 hypothetical protein Z520_04636 [Fonsecaea multimorphosa CBS 102226]OAL26211.1 hypothetical protein AYO22_04389 [Fonsecaea multimorphosa]